MPGQEDSETQVLIACVHGDQRYYPPATIWLKWRDRTETLRVGVLPRLDEDIILCTDYEDLPSLLDKAGQEHLLRTWWEEVPRGLVKEEPKEAWVTLSRRKKREQRYYYAQKALPRDGPEVARKVCTVTGDFWWNQNEDPSLKHAWQQALSPEEQGRSLLCCIGFSFDYKLLDLLRIRKEVHSAIYYHSQPGRV
ncbi:hypothetical protein NDU88_006211 [Pleurodeles waltl]|uniref:Uncharacterized protein n=1 Tax=Pleurodeles waltl TaxID=8319 RepID=A0AAV7TW58_PLEWA|nr:hypothetical protein NDU88_006211 [Pleurodeles waltl]